MKRTKDSSLLKKQLSKHVEEKIKELKQNSSSDKTSENNIANSEMVSATPIGNSPFIARKLDDKWFITIGKFRTPHTLNSFEECEDLVKNPDWYTIITCMNFVIDAVIQPVPNKQVSL